VLLPVGGLLLYWVASQGHDVWLHLLRDFGLAAGISALLGTAYGCVLRRDNEESMQGNLRSLLEKEEILRKSCAKRPESFDEAGLIKVHPELTGESVSRMLWVGFSLARGRPS